MTQYSCACTKFSIREQEIPDGRFNAPGALCLLYARRAAAGGVETTTRSQMSSYTQFAGTSLARADTAVHVQNSKFTS